MSCEVFGVGNQCVQWNGTVAYYCIVETCIGSTNWSNVQWSDVFACPLGAQRMIAFWTLLPRGWMSTQALNRR